MRHFILIFLFFIVSSLGHAEEKEADTFSAPPKLMRSTFKIECQGSIGTCFILGHNSTTNPGTVHYVLVTAKHVFEGSKGDIANIHFRKQIGDNYERVVQSIQIRDKGKPLWVSHPTADVAAIRPPVPQGTDIRNMAVLSTALLATDNDIEELEVQPGDELMVLGYPYGIESNDAGFPILRSGRIASFPLLPTRITKTFLLDFEVYEGNSGGPVFLYDRNRHFGGRTHIGRFRLIMGLVSQERNLTEQVKSLEEVSVKKHRLALAVIIHANLIRETIGMLFPNYPIPEPDN